MLLTGGRKSGKTSKMIEKSSTQWIYIVVANQQRAFAVSDRATEMGLEIPFPITAAELPLRSKFIKEVIVDDAEAVLEALIRKPVVAISTSFPAVQSLLEEDES